MMMLLSRAALRSLPITVWLLIFMFTSRQPLLTMPSHAELMEAVVRFGFRRKDWTARPYSVVTHMFVHASASHLASNMLACIAVWMEFGSSPTVQENVLGRSVLEAGWKATASTAVMVVGGVVGGMAGHFLHCMHRRHTAKVQYGLGIPIVQRIVGSVHRAAANRVYVCGASAGITAVGGFNASFYGRYLSGMFTLAVPLISLFVHDDGDGIGASDFFRREGAVGHAAHVGGFLVGCVLGAVCRRLDGVKGPNRNRRRVAF